MRQLAIVLLALGAAACVDRPPAPSAPRAAADSANQVIQGMSRSITRDGLRLTDITADSAWVFSASQVIALKTVSLTFFDDRGAVRSTVTADSGEQHENSGLLDLRGNVVAITPGADAKVLKTEHLIFDKSSNLIRSDTAYTFTSPSGNGSGQSFETDPDFRRFRSWQPKGFQKGQGFPLPGGPKGAP
ncbi:MAG: LPS export ABC transporter periplasmic protein LptC [Gemmatimonadota bacterium]